MTVQFSSVLVSVFVVTARNAAVAECIALKVGLCQSGFSADGAYQRFCRGGRISS